MDSVLLKKSRLSEKERLLTFDSCLKRIISEFCWKILAKIKSVQCDSCSCAGKDLDWNTEA
jgi:hypothetical protein